jgi:hypothetical protein
MKLYTVTHHKPIFFFLLLFFFGLNIFFGQNLPIADKSYIKEIEKLGKHESVKDAFKIIEEIDDQTIKDLIALTEIPAPPFQETERAIEFKALLEKAGDRRGCSATR